MIAIGCDHGGLNLKKAITAYFDANGIEIPFNQMDINIRHTS